MAVAHARCVHVFLNTSRAAVPQWRFPPHSETVFLDETWAHALRPRHRQILKGLRDHAHGPGRIYVLKAMLPWLLPHVDRAVVLDFDLLFRSPVRDLWDQFADFGPEHMIGVAPEAARHVYSGFSFPVNGGVQLMRLDRMRQGRYERMLHEIASSEGHRIGYLGDQTLYTLLAEAHRDAFYALSCRFNRQLNPEGTSFQCDDGCSVIHGNHAVWKQRFRDWAALGASVWAPALRLELQTYRWQRHFANCFTESDPRVR